MARRRRRRDPAKERLWRDRVAKLQSLGVSVREFCRREHLSESLMHAWRRELARRDAENRGQASDFSGQASGRKSASRVSVARYAPVTGQSATGPLLPIRLMGGLAGLDDPRDAQIEIILPANLRVLVRPGFDADLLRQVVDALALPAAAPC